MVNVIPAQVAGKIARDAGLANQSGYCPIDPASMKSVNDSNIYVVGDACIPGDMPKSAFSANSQAKVAAMMIRGELTNARTFPALHQHLLGLIETDDTVKVGGSYEPRTARLPRPRPSSRRRAKAPTCAARPRSRTWAGTAASSPTSSRDRASAASTGRGPCGCAGHANRPAGIERRALVLSVRTCTGSARHPQGDEPGDRPRSRPRRSPTAGSAATSGGGGGRPFRRDAGGVARSLCRPAHHRVGNGKGLDSGKLSHHTGDLGPRPSPECRRRRLAAFRGRRSRRRHGGSGRQVAGRSDRRLGRSRRRCRRGVCKAGIAAIKTGSISERQRTGVVGLRTSRW